MKIFHHRLFRHLALAVLIKLIVLAGLWWVFVRDSRVSVDADAVANRLGAVSQTSGENK